jgi:hypothetical protein
LVLVSDTSGDAMEKRETTDIMVNPFPTVKDGIDGILHGNGVLKFNESIDM